MSDLNWKKPVFVVCCTNSGSKLFQACLALHPDLALFPLEPHFLGFAPNLSGRLNRLFALHPCFQSSFADETSTSSPERGPLNKNFFQTAVESFWQSAAKDASSKYARHLADAQKGKRLVFKEPKFCLRIPWILNQWPDAKIIALHREPFAVIEGIRRRQPMMGDLPLHLDIATCTSQLAVCNAFIRMALRRFPDSIACLSYEKLISRWQDESLWNSICGFLGISQSVPTFHPDSPTPQKGNNEKSYENLTRTEREFINQFFHGSGLPTL